MWVIYQNQSTSGGREKEEEAWNGFNWNLILWAHAMPPNLATEDGPGEQPRAQGEVREKFADGVKPM